MKKVILASLLAAFAATGSASAGYFDTLRDSAPRSVFDDIRDSAPRSVFDDLRDTAPKSIWDQLNQTAPRDDGVFGDLQKSAP